MNRIILGLALTAAFLFSGCIDIIEELTLKSDGSGLYTLTTDMSIFMSKEMKDLMKDQEEEGAGAEEEPIEVDSMLLLSELYPEKFAALEHPEILAKAYMHLLMSDSQEKMIITYGLPFQKIEDINYFLKELGKFQTTEEDLLGGMGELGMPNTSITTELFSMKGKKTLIRHPQESGTKEELSEEELSSMEMMYEGGTYKTIYHFPGKIKKTTIPQARIEGNTLTVEAPLLDMLKGEIQLDGLIKFKRR